MLALIEEYQTELSDILGFADDTVDNYVSCLVKFCEFSKKQKLSPIDANGSLICKWMMTLKEKGLSYSRLEHHKSALKTFYAMLVKLCIVQRNPAEHLPQFRKKGLSNVRPVSKAVVELLLETIDQSSWHGKRNYMIISMLWALGLRISELTSLTVGSFETRHDPKNKIGLLRVKGKNRKQRALFVVDQLYDHLIAYLTLPGSLKKKEDPLFPVKSGKAISNSRVQKFMKQYCQLAGIKERITPHVLRHSFATEMYHANVPLDAIQVMMGHEKKAETAIYIKVNDQLKQEALLQITINERISWE